MRNKNRFIIIIIIIIIFIFIIIIIIIAGAIIGDAVPDYGSCIIVIIIIKWIEVDWDARSLIPWLFALLDPLSYFLLSYRDLLTKKFVQKIVVETSKKNACVHINYIIRILRSLMKLVYPKRIISVRRLVTRIKLW